MANQENEIKLIRQQIQTLDAKKFDLESWKAPTLIYLSRIFGSHSEHVRLIRELKYDYSSWSLRDTSGGVQQTDPVRSRAKEILEAAIQELENWGTPGNHDSSHVWEIFTKYLTGKEVEEVKSILFQPENERWEKLKGFFNAKEKEFLASLLAQLILSSPI